MIRYGLTPENTKLASDKAKSKKDGVYSFRNFLYRVRNNRITHYAYFGEIFENYGSFISKIDDYMYSDEARKILKGY